MAGTPTTNYKIPTYANSDAPDLTGSYNTAMGIIDAQMKTNETSAATVSSNLDTQVKNINNSINTLNSTVSGHTTKINTLESDVAALKTGSFVPSETDKTLTVAQLGQAKVTSNGIIYFMTTD